MAHSVEEALTLAERIGYPVIVRPSFVIGGLAIDFGYAPEDLVRQLAMATVVDPDRPVRIDRYLEGVEVDVDAVSDGTRRAHPGPARARRAGRRPLGRLGRRLPAADRLAGRPASSSSRRWSGSSLALGVRGLVNAQFIVRDDGVYLLEVNPRASRTVPFLSKVTGVPMVELAIRIALGATLARAGLAGRAAAGAARSSRSRRRCSRPPSCAASTRPSGPGCSRPARSSASTRTRAWRWPRRSSGPRSCRRGPGPTGALALLSIADRDKPLLAGWRRASPGPATGSRRPPGRAAALAALGHDARPVSKYGAGRRRPRGVPILELIASGEVRLVVNTPDAAVRARSATRPRSGWRPRPRASCA